MVRSLGPEGQDSQKTHEKSTPTRYFPWVRLWTELPSDPKFRTVSRLSKQPLPVVISVFVVLLTDAANAAVRGEPDIHAEDIASALDLDADQVTDVLEAMQGRLLDGRRLTGWDQRQPKREDGSAERAKEWRERNRTQANASEESRGEVEKKDLRGTEESLRRPGGGAHALVTFLTPGEAALAQGSLAALPCTGGVEAVLTEKHATELASLFPAVDVPQEVRAMRAWLLANPKNRKTPTGLLRFVAAWLAKEQNRARSPGMTPRPGKTADDEYVEQFLRRTGGKT